LHNSLPRFQLASGPLQDESEAFFIPLVEAVEKIWAPARIRTQIIPGNEGFENSVRILYGLAADGLYRHQRKAPQSFEHLTVCMSMSDTRLAGRLSCLNRVFRMAAIFARWRGVEKRLLLTYCQCRSE
jgi:hypothetical protein